MATQTAKVEKAGKMAKSEDHDEILEISDPAKYMLDNGILFYLNQNFFQLTGHDISVDYIDPANQAAGLKIQLFRYKKSNQTFDPDTFNKGIKKFQKFKREIIDPATHSRKMQLGFLIQSHADYREDQMIRKGGNGG